ncbi:hypothetical protein SKAU_G00392180 [Synaphobranchus kaupii]|uniref:Uncharacterized protein n=1 Tax=Synaphobranchus kaupii TaxID=118154 RepID=A0A9Q1EBS8_SYNKA|nr:hypothetical protein SKAU_G00392180 [Synaphobranchus kaupii]
MEWRDQDLCFAPSELEACRRIYAAVQSLYVMVGVCYETLEAQWADRTHAAWLIRSRRGYKKECRGYKTKGHNYWSIARSASETTSPANRRHERSEHGRRRRAASTEKALSFPFFSFCDFLAGEGERVALGKASRETVTRWWKSAPPQRSRARWTGKGGMTLLMINYEEE